MARSRRVEWGMVGAVLALLGCGCGGHPDDNDPGDGSGHKPSPDLGATEFVSADPNGAGPGGAVGGLTSGRESNDGAAPPTNSPTGMAGNAPQQRAVERGDIFRLLPDGRILNLNQYRGVQIIDIRDVSAPRVEGRLAVSGQPVELYLVGDRAIVLLNDWRGYYGTRDDVRVESVEGGLVMSVDLSDRANPRLLDQAPVRGSILTSRLTQGGDQAALYVAAQHYAANVVGNGPARFATPGTSKTVLKSFDVSSGALVGKSELDLGGYVQDIQATTDVMMVARHDYTRSDARSRVALVDISKPDGTMVLGDEVETSGMVQNKFNMDIWNGQLRIASGSNWNGTTNHLETYDVSDLADAKPLAHCSFGSQQSLFATLFLRDKAFFVTYLRQDPFHVFTIDEAGRCAERTEFIVSGWNTFFRAVMDETRLIGIGNNDENRQTQLAVSLYDITDVFNPNPLLARAQIDLNWAYSEGTADDRAFSVLEDAVSIDAADGTEETGLVLLPFSGYDEARRTFESGVQIFTFSDRTLTARGVMEHGSPVRRSFEAAADTTANLSEEQISLFDTADPSNPAELGRVDLAPNFQKVLIYGDYVARVRDRASYYGYSENQQRPDSLVEIVPRDGDLEGDGVVATVNVPAGSEVVQVGDLLVAIQTRYVPSAAGKETYRTDIQVHDLTDPSAPRAGGALTSDRLQPYWGGGYYGGRVPGGLLIGDCVDCGRFPGAYYSYAAQRIIVPGAIVFPRTQSRERSLGWFEECYESPNNEGCTVSTTGEANCPAEWYAGGIACSRPRGTRDEVCGGEFYVCSRDSGTCEPGRPARGTQKYCNTNERFRYWSSFTFDVLDLRDPDRPVLGPALDMPDDEEGTSVLAAGDAVYFSYQKPIDVANDPRPFVRRYVRKLDFSDVGHPVSSGGINVPGEVIAVAGATLYTRDLVWGETRTETLIARLELDGAVARLQAQRLFDGRAVSSVELDGAGHVLVSHDPAWAGYYGGYGYGEPRPHRLSILDDRSLAIAGETDIDSWASFVAAENGRALFSVSGGVLIVDVSDAASPYAQAYFPTASGWSAPPLLDGDEILYAAGPYGVYRLDATTYNLLTKP